MKTVFDISKKIAYRFYTLQSNVRFIAFNTITRDYLFLEGLSAELLKILIENKELNVFENFCDENELTKDDLDEFLDFLNGFGFFYSNTNTSNLDMSQTTSADIEEKEEYNPYLDEFRELLYSNGLTYSIHIDMTNRCNEKCVHCYHPFDKYDYSIELTTEELKKLIDIAYDIGVFSITISGGECLLRKDFFEILDYIASKHMLVALFTNGILLTEDVVKKLNDYPINIVSVSIYGDTSELHDSITQIKGSFMKTLNGIANLKKYNLEFELKCVVMDKNVSRMEEIRVFLKELANGRDCRLDTFLFRKMDGTCENCVEQAPIESLKKLIEIDPNYYFMADRAQRRANDIDESPCNAGRYNLYCDAHGKVYPCVNFRLPLCNYTELKEIKHNKVLNEWFNTKLRNFTNCYTHDYCGYCTEQCPGRNLLENGDYHDSRNVSTCEKAKIIMEWYKKHSDNKI